MHQNTDGLTCQIIEAGSRSLKIGSWSVLILQTNNNNSATNFSRIEKSSYVGWYTANNHFHFLKLVMFETLSS